MDEAVEKIEEMLATPITLYGRVVDQNGDAVPNARVGYSLVDKFNESGSAAAAHPDKLIVTESILDGLAIFAAKKRNVIAAYGADGWSGGEPALLG